MFILFRASLHPTVFFLRGSLIKYLLRSTIWQSHIYSLAIIAVEANMRGLETLECSIRTISSSIEFKGILSLGGCRAVTRSNQESIDTRRRRRASSDYETLSRGENGSLESANVSFLGSKEQHDVEEPFKQISN